MAYQYDELNRRRAQRKQQQQVRDRKRRGRRLRVIGAGAAIGLVVLLIFVVLAVRGCQDSGSAQTQPPQTTAPPQTTVPVPTEPKTVITIAAAGDLNITDRVVAAGQQDGAMDFTAIFRDVAPLFAGAHGAVLNFEGNLCGAPYGSESTSAPAELAQALANMGVDMVQMANSCTVNNGLSGLNATLNGLRSAGLEPLGAFASQAEFEESGGFTLRNIGGIRVAFVAFTKGVGSLGLPAGSQNQVNLLYTDYASTYQKVDKEGITAVLKAVERQKPDVTIAMLHWGSEYNDEHSDSQETITELMLANGVDAIIGSHPHYVQQVRYDAAKGQVVAYSLGDFLGDATAAGTNYSVVLQLQITRDNLTGETKITGCDYVPIYILTPENDGLPLQVVRIREAIKMYENSHVSAVSAETYENMKYVLERIDARINGK